MSAYLYNVGLIRTCGKKLKWPAGFTNCSIRRLCTADGAGKISSFIRSSISSEVQLKCSFLTTRFHYPTVLIT